MVSRHDVIGLTAGASTPGELVDATIERLAELGHDEVVEVTVAREDVHFRLPREVASA
jgi:4-hydroxy-3-methylbut-2-enyl diphosphate reductase